MKVTKWATVIALPVMLFSTALVNAATDRDAVQACSEAIATTIEKRQGAAVNLRVDQSGINPTEKLVSGTTMFEVKALDASTEDVIGRFRCQVNRSAEVLRLRTLALDVPAASRQNPS